MKHDMAPNDVLAIDMCGLFTPSLGGNLYMFYGVDHASRSQHPQTKPNETLLLCPSEM